MAGEIPPHDLDLVLFCHRVRIIDDLDIVAVREVELEAIQVPDDGIGLTAGGRAIRRQS